MKEKSGRRSHGREIMASKRHSGGTQEVSRDPQEAHRGNQEATRRHPGHQGGQGRRKIDESMKNIEKQMVFFAFGRGHRADILKTLSFSMFLGANV